MGIFGRLESRFFEKFGGTLGGAGVMTERFAPGEVEGCGGMGLRKGFGGFSSHLEGSGSARNVNFAERCEKFRKTVPLEVEFERI